jgi:cysteine desulfurase family protein
MEAMKDYGANPGRSGHKLALKINRGMYDTRMSLAQLFNIDDPMNLIFTFNCTESLNLGIKGVLQPGDHVITTSMEHNSVLRPIRYLEQFGVESTIVKANCLGEINVEDIKSQIRDNTKLIVTTHISNLTGTIMPIRAIGELAKEYGVLYLIDAAQSAGIYEIDAATMNVDMIAFPGHKGLLGPQGTGGLYIRKGLEIKEIFQGGTGSMSESLIQPDMSPDRYESGTPNGPGIIGLGAGVEYINSKGMDQIRNHEEGLTRYFIEEVSKISGIKLYGPCDITKQAAVVSLNIKDYDSSEIAYILDEQYDIMVRPGLHCAPLAHKTIGTLDQGVVRFSFSPFNTLEEIEYGIKSLREIVKEI